MNNGRCIGGGHHGLKFYDVISIENLFEAWNEFKKGKRSKREVAIFELNLENNIFRLSDLFISGEWKPDSYQEFSVYDPKPRTIHKASVRDRVLYQAIYRKLYQIFDPGFIFHSYSSRNFKGIHAGVSYLEKCINKVSRNHTRPCFLLKCDIRKFFDSVDHQILLSLISRKISDKKLLFLINSIIKSFEKNQGKGLPLGNVTSQLFSNIYMNEMDQYAKRTLKIKYYMRYCDDFVMVSSSKRHLEFYVANLKKFCKEKLLLDIHPQKIIFRKAIQGVDFLGYIVLPHRKVLRTKTKNRILKKLEEIKRFFDNGLIEQKHLERVVQSYFGILAHCESGHVAQKIERIFWD